MPIITDTTTGQSYTPEEFEDEAPSLYDGHEDCIEAAIELVRALRAYQDTQPYASYLGVELGHGLAMWANVNECADVTDDHSYFDDPESSIYDGLEDRVEAASNVMARLNGRRTGLIPQKGWIVYNLGITFEGDEEGDAIMLIGWPGHTGHMLEDQLSDMYGGSWHWENESSLDVTR